MRNRTIQASVRGPVRWELLAAGREGKSAEAGAEQAQGEAAGGPSPKGQRKRPAAATPKPGSAKKARQAAAEAGAEQAQGEAAGGPSPKGQRRRPAAATPKPGSAKKARQAAAAAAAGQQSIDGFLVKNSK